MLKKRNPVDDILNQYGVMILDGALATELERHGFNLNDPLWSARVLLENPEMIYRVHADYFHAGADCAITASYQATVDGLAARGLGEEAALDLIKETVHLAKRARDDFWQEDMRVVRPKPLVAASVGPYGAFLADGSEYTGNYGISDEELKAFHFKRMKALIDAGANILAFETIPSLQEAKVLSALLQEFPEIYALLSFSLRDGMTISDGTLLRECANVFAENNQIAAIGINCAATTFVGEAINLLKSYSDKPIVVYPNTGEIYDPKTKTWHGSESCESFDILAEEWYKAGARIIGGCCRTEPHHIEAITKRLR